MKQKQKNSSEYYQRKQTKWSMIGWFQYSLYREFFRLDVKLFITAKWIRQSTKSLLTISSLLSRVCWHLVDTNKSNVACVKHTHIESQFVKNKLENKITHKDICHTNKSIVKWPYQRHPDALIIMYCAHLWFGRLR